MGTAKQTRPTGVTILAVVQIIGSILGLIAGLGAISAVGVLGMVDGGRVPIPGMTNPIGGFLQIVGIAGIIVGLIGFPLAWGLWTGKGWAWLVGIIFAVYGIVVGLISLPFSILGILISGLVLFYLTRPAVKAYFGRGPVNVTE